MIHGDKEICFFFQAEDGIRDAQESRGLGDVYKRQLSNPLFVTAYRILPSFLHSDLLKIKFPVTIFIESVSYTHLTLPTNREV